MKMSDSEIIGNYRPESDILPIFVANYAYEKPPLISHQGTGFLVGKNVFVTCWHCVREELQGDLVYVVLKEEADGEYILTRLRDIQQDPSGTDLATAQVNLKPELGLTVAEDTWYRYGTDVWTFGYPLTGVEAHPDALPGALDTETGKRFTLNGRYMQSYTMRNFMNDWPEFGRIPSWELDMPALAGMSGAPLVRMGSREIIGVMYGHHEAETIEEFGTRDPETREWLRPEVVRRNYFAVAHYTWALQTLRGKATNEQPPFDFLRELEEPVSNEGD
jgi:hypothetical protein